MSSKLRLKQPTSPVYHSGVDRKSLLCDLSVSRPICNSCLPEAPSDPFERQNSDYRPTEFTPFRSSSCHPRVSIILIKFIFADNNNCKYNLTNYLTHNILYMKS